jgi:hypothetical protein
MSDIPQLGAGFRVVLVRVSLRREEACHAFA